MSVARSVADVCVTMLCLSLRRYLQTVRPVVGCLRVHRGHGASTRYLFPSSIACFPE